MAKLNVGVFFGSRSVEHEVSVVSAVQLMQNVDRAKYDITAVYIDAEGIWYTGEVLFDINFYKKHDYTSLRRVFVKPIYNDHGLYCEKKTAFGTKTERLCNLDVALTVFHGVNGEDGCIQGLFELMGLPYSSSGVLGSSLGMDKIAMKQVFTGAGLPVVPYTWFERSDMESDPASVVSSVAEKLGYPVFVKPANLGSSIGISRCDDAHGLMNALEVAFSYDRRVIVEKAVTELTEINCSALGYGSQVRVSLCEQPSSGGFLGYDDKYLSDASGKKTGMQSMARQIPAMIDEALTKEIEHMTTTAFTLLNSKGVVRIDYLIDNTAHKLYINEINTIPGSLAFYLWEGRGLKYPALVDELINIAIDARHDEDRNTYAYTSLILDKAAKGLGKLRK